MKLNIKFLVGSLLLACTTSANAIFINFDYSLDNKNFFSNQARKDVLNSAGHFFENRLNDQLGAISSAGNNKFNINFSRPDTGKTQTKNDFSVAADTLTIFAGGRTFSGSILGQGGSGGFGASGTATFIESLKRGQGNVSGSTATDFAPWGGSIAFDLDSVWYFDNDTRINDVPSGKSDFFSVALHELGHVLGFGTADSWKNLISGTNFTGANSVTVNNGNPVMLDSGLAHWKNGTLSLVDGVSQEAAMDPSISVGSRKAFTNLDLAGLQDIGWEVAVVPVPPALLLFSSALFGLAVLRKKLHNMST